MRKSLAYFSVLLALGCFLVAASAMAQVQSSDRIVISANERTATEFPSPNFHPIDQFIAEDGETAARGWTSGIGFLREEE